MKLGLDVSQHQLTWEELVERTRFAEDAGFDGAWVFDHFTALYADPKGPCLEAWTLLAGLAAVTTRIRLGTLVTGITYRHPSMLAMEAVTVDHISGGRVELAIGAAWHEPEHRRLGIDFPSPRERVQRVEEAIKVMKILMTSEDGEDFDGEHYRLEGGWYRPKPVQQPHPPIWIGSSSPKMLRLAATHADAWHTYGDPASIARLSKTIDEHAHKAGRDPKEIMRSAQLDLSQPWDKIRRDAEGYASAGVSYLTVGWPGEGRTHLEEFVSTHLPDIAALHA